MSILILQLKHTGTQLPFRITVLCRCLELSVRRVKNHREEYRYQRNEILLRVRYLVQITRYIIRVPGMYTYWYRIRTKRTGSLVKHSNIYYMRVMYRFTVQQYYHVKDKGCM